MFRFSLIKIILFLLSVSCTIFCYQHVVTLNKEKKLLATKVDELTLQNNRYKNQSLTLSRAMMTERLTIKNLKEGENAIHQQLQQAMANNQCAAQPIPIAVIRLQQRAIFKSRNSAVIHS